MFNVKDEVTPGEKFYHKKRRQASIEQFVPSIKRIMVVDDEVFNIYAIQGLMQVLGMPHELENVDVCYNGEQAVDLVRKAIQENDADRYSLILTDCSMPFMDGYQASQKIRKLMQDTKIDDSQSNHEIQARVDDQLQIIAITGHVEPEYIIKAHKHGINHVFPKPMPIVKLGHILMDKNFIKEIPKHLTREE